MPRPSSKPATEIRKAIAKRIGESAGRLREIAAVQLKNERRNHTLTPSALVNEAALVLLRQRNLANADAEQFFKAANKTIQRVLIDYGRKKQARKRGASREQVPLSGIDPPQVQASVDLQDVREALDELCRRSQRIYNAVMLHCGFGMGRGQVARALQTSSVEVEGDVAFALAWLSRRLSA